MFSLIDYDFDEHPIFETMLLIFQEIRPEMLSGTVEKQLAKMVKEARSVISGDLCQDQQLEQLITLFYKTWGFGGANGVYRFTDTLWLDKVLQSRQGAPVSLGIIFLHIAHQLELPLVPVVFPTQLILRAEWLDNELWLINPLNGETLSEHQLNMWLKGHLGSTVALDQDDLNEAENVAVIRKFLSVMKGALMQEQQLELALKTCEVMLAMMPGDPYEIRDRGLIYAQLECHSAAVNDLSYFIEQCPEDPVVEMLKMQIDSFGQERVVLH